MILKCFFDGGNKADSREYEVATLACMCGTKLQWDPLELAWRQILDRYAVDYLHTTDVVSGNGIYKRMREEARHQLLSDCVNLIGNFIAIPYGRNSGPRHGILPLTVTIVLQDFMAAWRRGAAPSHPDEALMRQAVGGCLRWGTENAGTRFYEFHFDRGEPFYGYMCNVLESKKAKDDAFLLRQVIGNLQMDMRSCPALQMADVFAWCVSHKLRQPHYEWQAKLLGLPRADEWHDEASIRQPHPKSELWNTWRIPRRARPK